jgi:hypothetical protein
MNFRKRFAAVLLVAIVGISGLGVANASRADAYIYPFYSIGSSECKDLGAWYASLASARLTCSFPAASSLYVLAAPYQVWRHTYGTGHLYNGVTESLNVDKTWSYANCNEGMCLHDPYWYNSTGSTGDPMRLPTVQVSKGRYHCFYLTTELWFPAGSGQWKVFTKVDIFDGVGNRIYAGSWSQPR